MSYFPNVVFLGSDGRIAWASLKPEVQNLPISFILPGKPAVSAIFNVVIAQATMLPANLAGTVVFDSTQTSASAEFIVNKISAGTTTAIASITITTGSNTSVTLSTQAAVSFAINDVLQLVAPSAQDATLADVSITIMTLKV